MPLKLTIDSAAVVGGTIYIARIQCTKTQYIPVMVRRTSWLVLSLPTPLLNSQKNLPPSAGTARINFNSPGEGSLSWRPTGENLGKGPILLTWSTWVGEAEGGLYLTREYYDRDDVVVRRN